jgi:hypothetical protein
VPPCSGAALGSLRIDLDPEDGLQSFITYLFTTQHGVTFQNASVFEGFLV